MIRSSSGNFMKDCTLKGTTETSISTPDLQVDTKIRVMCARYTEALKLL